MCPFAFSHTFADFASREPSHSHAASHRLVGSVDFTLSTVKTLAWPSGVLRMRGSVEVAVEVVRGMNAVVGVHVASRCGAPDLGQQDAVLLHEVVDRVVSPATNCGRMGGVKPLVKRRGAVSPAHCTTCATDQASPTFVDLPVVHAFSHEKWFCARHIAPVMGVQPHVCPVSGPDGDIQCATIEKAWATTSARCAVVC